MSALESAERDVSKRPFYGEETGNPRSRLLRRKARRDEAWGYPFLPRRITSVVDASG
ncbi:MAG: hypothetical protein ACR2QO_10690 [Acidimicrobiales bacterium]